MIVFHQKKAGFEGAKEDESKFNPELNFETSRLELSCWMSFFVFLSGIKLVETFQLFNTNYSWF